MHLTQWHKSARKCTCIPATKNAYNEVATKFFLMAAISRVEKSFQPSMKGNAAECYAFDVTETGRTRTAEH